MREYLARSMRFRDRETIGRRVCTGSVYTGRRAGFNELPPRLSLHIYACGRYPARPERRIFREKLPIQTSRYSLSKFSVIMPLPRKMTAKLFPTILLCINEPSRQIGGHLHVDNGQLKSKCYVTVLYMSHYIRACLYSTIFPSY